MSVRATGAGPFSTFWIEGHLFGLDVLNVQEVIRDRETTPVPLAPAAVSGLINLRGQIVLALDLRRRLGLPARSVGAGSMHVVVRTADGVVSLLVDEIGEVADVAGCEIETAPETLPGTARALVAGACRLKGVRLLLLDVERTVRVGGQPEAG